MFPQVLALEDRPEAKHYACYAEAKFHAQDSTGIPCKRIARERTAGLRHCPCRSRPSSIQISQEGPSAAFYLSAAFRLHVVARLICTNEKLHGLEVRIQTSSEGSRWAAYKNLAVPVVFRLCLTI